MNKIGHFIKVHDLSGEIQFFVNAFLRFVKNIGYRNSENKIKQKVDHINTPQSHSDLKGIQRHLGSVKINNGKCHNPNYKPPHQKTDKAVLGHYTDFISVFPEPIPIYYVHHSKYCCS